MENEQACTGEAREREGRGWRECVSERERERESVCADHQFDHQFDHHLHEACVLGCAMAQRPPKSERERERERVCVCACERERELP